MLHTPPTSGAKKTAHAFGPQSDIFKVSAIGSCRVLAPLKSACSATGYETNQTGIYGYCHSSTEALQQVEHLQNGTLPPHWLRPIVAPNLIASTNSAKHQPSDLYFVELCSSKILSVDGHAIQLNYLTRHLNAFFKSRDRARSYWGLLRLQDDARLRAFLNADEIYQYLTDADQYILANLKLRHSTLDTLLTDISAIRTYLPNVIFVTHFDVRKHDDTLLIARAEYLSLLRDALDESRCKWFDPSDYVAAFGQSDALEDGASLSHYSDDFIALLANNWMTRYIKPQALLSQKALRTPKPIQTEIQPAQTATAS